MVPVTKIRSRAGKNQKWAPKSAPVMGTRGTTLPSRHFFVSGVTVTKFPKLLYV